MRYFFESGSFQNISQAELVCVFESFNISRDCIKKISDHIFLIENNNIEEGTLLRIFNRLGGFVRLGEIVDNLDVFLDKYTNSDKVTFGISLIDSRDIDIKNIQKLSNDIKRFFKERDIKVRFILPKNNELNAAQVIHNEIIDKGFELCIISSSNNEKIYGRTLSIQDIDSYIFRDENKPSADLEMGVLPHKLARMMCNLTSLKDGLIWDPFCGSGTILMEASILGFNILGSDIDERAIESAEKNIEWLHEEGVIGEIKYNIFDLDINRVPKKTLNTLKKTNINAIVCEPFMGPPQRKVISEFRAKELIEDVKILYRDLFSVLGSIGREGFKVVMIVPSYKTYSGWKTFNISEIIGKRWEVLNKKYCKEDLKWERNNSIISRNIFILSKR